MVVSLAHTGTRTHSNMTSSRVWVPGLCLTAATICDAAILKRSRVWENSGTPRAPEIASGREWSL
jgi:hypothetical protein